MTDLGHGVEGTRDVQDTLGVAGDRLGDSHTRTRLLLHVSLCLSRRSPRPTLISLTCEPCRPMITLASCVTIRQRMEICWTGGSAAGTGADGTEDGGWMELRGGDDCEGPASLLMSITTPDRRSVNKDHPPVHVAVLHLLLGSVSFVLLGRSGVFRLVSVARAFSLGCTVGRGRSGCVVVLGSGRSSGVDDSVLSSSLVGVAGLWAVWRSRSFR